MKIIGTTDHGYLALISETEIGIVLGFGKYPTYGDTKAAFLSATGRAREGEKIKTDTEIAVVEGFDYLTELQQKGVQAAECANVLRQLADLISHRLPSVVIPPPTNEEGAS